MSAETFLKGTDMSYNSKNKMSVPDEGAVHDIGKKAGETASQVATSAANRYQSTRQYVKRHPTTGVLVAAATGMAIGSIITNAFGK